MPHQCTNCEHVFEDGSQEMLSGCPDCGGKKFQFKPGSIDDKSTTPETPTTQAPEQPVERTEDTDGDIIDASEADESPAQANARSDVVSPSDLDEVSAWPGQDESETVAVGGAVDADEENPPEDPYEREVWEQDKKEEMGLDELRQELNSQFESIKILSPGEYKLNLMELYERQEYIIALQEDGRYKIEVPNTWSDDE